MNRIMKAAWEAFIATKRAAGGSERQTAHDLFDEGFAAAVNLLVKDSDLYAKLVVVNALQGLDNDSL